jgi:hypothetical protein
VAKALYGHAGVHAQLANKQLIGQNRCGVTLTDAFLLLNACLALLALT